MSRIGKMPINIPAGVTISVDDNNTVTVKGKSETLSHTAPGCMTVAIDGSVVNVQRSDDNPSTRALHGLTRTIVFNMVKGVSEGFTKELDIVGVGYRAAKQGKQLVMNLGYSHQIIMDEKNGVTVDVPAPNKIIVKGADKQAVGQFAAEVREKRPPEPYLGKGVRYTGEVIILKEGKTGAKKK